MAGEGVTSVPYRNGSPTVLSFITKDSCQAFIGGPPVQLELIFSTPVKPRLF